MAFGVCCHGKPLFFFYDCETTGPKIEDDAIVEVAAVLYTKNLQRGFSGPQEFTSLVSCDRALSSKTKELTGLTDADLRGKPSLKCVLHGLFDWIKETVQSVSTRERRPYFPVLAAHSGRFLDFPMLFIAVRNHEATDPSLQRKFDRLNLHYGDTFSVFKHFDLSGECPELTKLGLKNIYSTYFADPVDNHRAMADAKMLHRIFSDSPRTAEFMATLGDFLQTKTGIEITQSETPKFKRAHVNYFHAIELLQRGITYQTYMRGSSRLH